MSDASVAALLRSDHPLVLIEAPAGCGKTFQGAAYANDVTATLGNGRLLVLTHTHGACGVFAERTKGHGTRVEIKTIDALIAQIGAAYRQALGLPENLSTWAWQDGGQGFDILARRVAAYLDHHPMIAQALARRYPVIVCDEHQDSTAERHAIIMALGRAGARLRIFGDPMQWIFGGRSAAEEAANRARWDALKAMAAFDELDVPHRWTSGSSELGQWILESRERLKRGDPVDLSKRVAGLTIVRAENASRHPAGYQLSRQDRQPLDRALNSRGKVMVLATQRERVDALSAFWGRRVPVWEGHTRPALADLVAVARDHVGNRVEIATGIVRFLAAVAVGFTPSGHGARLVKEAQENCAKATRGTPKHIQDMARKVVEEPNHRGVAAALEVLLGHIDAKADGFADIKVDHKSEFRDAIRLGGYSGPDEGFAEIARRRSHAMPSPPLCALSTVHKSKGLECDHALIVSCDKDQFSDTHYSRCRLYVAISRARHSLTLVASPSKPSPLLQF